MILIEMMDKLMISGLRRLKDAEALAMMSENARCGGWDMAGPIHLIPDDVRHVSE